MQQPTAAERLGLIWPKIERAKKHLLELDSKLNAFRAANPYKLATKHDPRTGNLIYYVASVDATPQLFSTVAGDAIQNLRTALDYLHQQLWMVGTNNDAPCRGKAVSFYFDGNPGSNYYSKSALLELDGLRQNAKEALMRLEPYKGGKGNDLWMLNTLSNIDKHRLLFTVGAAYTRCDAKPQLAPLMAERLGGESRSEPFLASANRLRPLRVGDEMLIDLPDADPNPQLSLQFEIAIHEAELGAPMPLSKLIHDLTGAVSRVVMSFRPHLQ